MAQANLPVRSNTDGDDDVFGGEDTSETTKLFLERLQAYKHACGYLEEYITQLEKNQVSQAKESEKAIKLMSRPLREAHHFDQSLGGISELFDNIRGNSQNIATSHTETAKQLKSTVLPIFERLHAEVKSKAKELEKGAGKNSKAVDKARAVTQKHIEALGQAAASHETASALGGKADASNDPYILHKGVFHRLNKQIQEENANRQDMLTVQSNFAQFEAHVISVFQDGFGHLNRVLDTALENQKAYHSQMTQKAQTINPLFEWNGFVARRKDLLIDPNAEARTLETITFPNQGHRSTQAIIQGSLERKTGLLKKYDSAFYAVTPSKFLHQFATDDNLSKDPSSDLSLYLPDCTVGGCQNGEFSIKGKDVGKGKFGNALAQTTEFKFKAHSPAEAESWWNIIREVAGASASPSGATSPLSASSPTSSRQVSAAHPSIDTHVQGQEAGSVPASATGPASSAAATTGTSGLEGKPGQY